MRSLIEMLDEIKHHPQFHRAGMILCHNGVVRRTSRDGRPVSGLKVAVDHDQLRAVIASAKKRPGIIEVLVEIAQDTALNVGDDIMYLVVAGDVREHVLATLEETLNAVKRQVTHKTEF
jgi:molybdopterin synthase catalytic subunit